MNRPIGPGQIYSDPAKMLECIIKLPFCILAENASHSSSILSVQALIDNGLTPEKAAEYARENQELAQSLVESNSKLVVAQEDTVESLAKQIRNLSPGLSDEFVDFYAKQILVR